MGARTFFGVFTVTVHGYDALDDRHTAHHSVMDGHAARGVEEDTAHICGQLSGRELAAGQGVHKLTLVTLRVFGLANADLDVREVPCLALKGGDGLGLVVLNGDVGRIKAENMHKYLHTVDETVGVLDHNAAVCGYVGLALGAVDDDVVDLTESRTDLGIGWEHCAAHARNSRQTDALYELVRRAVKITALKGHDVGTECSLPVVFYNDILDRHSLGVVAGVDGYDLARNAGVYGATEGVLHASDHLAAGDGIANLDQRRTGRAYML